MLDRISNALLWIGRAAAYALLALGWWHGAIDKDYDHATFDLVMGIVGLYLNGWRPAVGTGEMHLTINRPTWINNGDAGASSATSEQVQS